VPGRMPDFRGLRMSQALRALALLQRDTQVTYSLFGAGVVTRQTPEPGKGLAEKEKIMLYFEE
jgi:beta-lactam-binding protein with PASTA domain